MEYRRGMMKGALAESLRELMCRKMFEKITIKQICDETGVIRATFYNYFEDKYDCLYWIVHTDMALNEKFDDDEPIERRSHFEKIFKNIEDNREFYKIAYGINGQNSFADMVKDNISELMLKYLESCRKPNFMPQYDNRFLARYFAESMAFIVHEFVFDRNGMSSREALKLIKELLLHTFDDFCEFPK